MAASAPRSYRIHWPSPCADQRVARLLSRVFCGTLPSLALATTATTKSAVREPARVRSRVRGGPSGRGSVRSHASARTALAASDAFIRASRLDSLNLKFILGLLLLPRDGPLASTNRSTAGGPQDHCLQNEEAVEGRPLRVPLIGTDVV